MVFHRRSTVFHRPVGQFRDQLQFFIGRWQVSAVSRGLVAVRESRIRCTYGIRLRLSLASLSHYSDSVFLNSRLRGLGSHITHAV